MRDTLQAERAFVGCILRSPEQVRSVGGVTAEMLDDPGHRRIFKAIQYAHTANGAVSTQALLSILPRDLPDHGPTEAVIAALKANAEGAGAAGDYAEALLEREAQRRVTKVNEWIAEQTKRGEMTVEEIAAEASRRLAGVMEVASPIRRVKLADAARSAIKNARAVTAQEAPGVTTGIAPLDKIVGRLYGLTFLLASQSEGKSALAAQIAIHCAEAGRPALIFQFEMDAEEMGVREVVATSELKMAEVLSPQVDAFDAQVIGGAIMRLDALPVYVIEDDRMTVEQIGAQCRAMDREVGLSLVVIDQLDKIKSAGKHRDRFERMEEITGDLKSLAKAMPHVTFLVLGQRTRGAQKRDDPTPEINDADAPGIERNADVILAIWFHANWLRRQRPSKGGAEQMDKWEGDMRRAAGKAEGIVLKHRRRKAFEQCEMRFHGERMRFAELNPEAT